MQICVQHSKSCIKVFLLKNNTLISDKLQEMIYFMVNDILKEIYNKIYTYLPF